MAQIEGRTLLRPGGTIKEQNRQRIVREVMIQPASQSRLAHLTGLSNATVSTIVRELADLGVVKIDSPERGRDISLNEVSGIAVGLDVGYSHVTVVARRVDRADDVIKTISLSPALSATTWMNEAAHLVHEVLAILDGSLDQVISIGLGHPGSVDPRTGELSNHPLSMSWDFSVSPARMLSDVLGLHVTAVNDANVGALGELLFGAGRSSETFLYVKAATGIGAGLMVGGNIFRGRRGIAMELGHVTMQPDGIVCACGKRGCLETLVGAEYLIEQTRRAKIGYRSQAPDTMDRLIERARAGDRICIRVLEDAGRWLGYGLAQICILIDPDLVAIGGLLAGAFDLFSPEMLHSFTTHALPTGVQAQPRPDIVSSVLGPKASGLGALALGLRSNRLAHF